MAAYEKGVVLHTTNMEKKYSFNGKVILDVRFGDGKMVKRIAEKYAPKYITGVDMFLWRKEEKTENSSLINGVAAKHLPFEDNSFD